MPLVFVADEIVTAAKMNILGSSPRHYRQTTTAGSSSGATEVVIATLVVPAQPMAVLLIPSAHHTLVNDAADNPDWVMRIREDTVSGTILGGVQNRHFGASTNIRIHYSIASAAAASAAISTAKTLVLTLQRATGSGTVASASEGGALSALVIPSMS